MDVFPQRSTGQWRGRTILFVMVMTGAVLAFALYKSELSRLLQILI